MKKESLESLYTAIYYLEELTLKLKYEAQCREKFNSAYTSCSIVRYDLENIDGYLEDGFLENEKNICECKK